MSETRGEPDSQTLLEWSVLGGLLNVGRADVIQELVRPIAADAFTHETHEALLRAITITAGEVAPADSVTLAAAVQTAEAKTDVSRSDALGLLSKVRENADSRQQVVAGEVVRLNAEAGKRRIIRTIHGVLAEARDPQSTDLQVISAAESALQSVVEARDATTGPDDTSVSSALEALSEQMERRRLRGHTPELSSGMADVDRLLDGTPPGQTTVLAARPQVGKTALALHIARAGWLQNRQGEHARRGTAIYTLEMSQTQLMERLISAESTVPAQKIRTASYNEDELEKIDDAMARALTQWGDSLVLVPSAGWTSAQIASHFRQVVARWNRVGVRPAGFIVDYIQNVASSNARDDMRTKVTKASQELTALTRQTSTHGLLISQLRRADGASHQISMDDLKESGQLEQDADTVLAVDRPDATDPESPDAGMVFLETLKDRHFGNGGRRISLHHELATYRFFDITRATEPSSWGAPAIP